MSRLAIEEATVTIQGLIQDLLVLGPKNQNRALNGDIVCLEVFQESEWLRNYKTGVPVNVLEQEVLGLEDND